MEWYQGSQNYQDYQGYQDYQNYQEYQGNSFRHLPIKKKFQQEMASNNYQWSNKRGLPKKASSTHNVDSITMLTEQVASLVKMMGNMGQLNSISNPILTCDFGRGSYMNNNCSNIEQAQYMGNFNRQP